MTGQERRCYDGEIAGIRKLIEVSTKTQIKMLLNVQKIGTLQQEYIKQITEIKDDTAENTKDITTIKAKQSLIIWIGGTIGGIAVIVFSVSLRFVLSHLHIKGP